MLGKERGGTKQDCEVLISTTVGIGAGVGLADSNLTNPTYLSRAGCGALAESVCWWFASLCTGLHRLG